MKQRTAAKRRPALLDEAPAKKKRPVPFAFVLDLLCAKNPVVKPMFGCYAVYIDSLLVVILRDRDDHPEANGVWLATHKEHHASLLKEFPAMQSIGILSGGGPTNWQILHVSNRDFEESVTRACELVLRGDPRIGSRPRPRKPRRT